MSIDARLKKLAPVLSARERAVLVLQSVRNKTPEDPQWRNTMPDYQHDEFNRYIRLINRCTSEMAFLITVIEKEVDKLELLSTVWYMLQLWQTNMAEVDFLASVMAREPITESEHRRLVEVQEKTLLPVSALALELAEHQRGWGDEDLAPAGATSELVVKDHSGRRLRDEAEDQVRSAVAAGDLTAKGKGADLKVRSGDFDSWLGRPTRAHPAWAGNYEVFADSDAGLVEAGKRTLANLRSVIDLTPLQRSGRDGAGTASLEQMVDGVQSQLKAGIARRWSDLREVEIVLSEVEADLNGVDPLKPVNRAVLAGARQRLFNLQRVLGAARVDLELPEPEDEDLDLMRQFVAGNVP